MGRVQIYIINSPTDILYVNHTSVASDLPHVGQSDSRLCCEGSISSYVSIDVSLVLYGGYNPSPWYRGDKEGMQYSTVLYAISILNGLTIINIILFTNVSTFRGIGTELHAM